MIYAGVNLAHISFSLNQSPNNALIFCLLLKAECSTDAVFEPLLGRQVTADEKCPSHLWHWLEILFVIDPNTPRLNVRPRTRFNGAASILRSSGFNLPPSFAVTFQTQTNCVKRTQFEPACVTAHIARIGDGNIIRTGDGANSKESYCFGMKSLSAFLSGQNSRVVSIVSGHDDFIHADKHQTQ